MSAVAAIAAARPLLEIENLAVEFGSKAPVRVVDGVGFAIAAGAAWPLA